MNAQDINPWLSMLSLVMSIGGVVYLWMTAGSRANSSQIASLRSEVELVEGRLTRAEVAIQYLPDKDITHRLEMAILELKGQVSLVSVKMEPVSEMARMVHDKMFSEGGK